MFKTELEWKLWTEIPERDDRRMGYIVWGPSVGFFLAFAEFGDDGRFVGFCHHVNGYLLDNLNLAVWAEICPKLMFERLAETLEEMNADG